MSSISEPSFKIYVGTFPEKNVSFSGNAITIYQIGSFKYEATVILNNIDVINEYYGDSPAETCTNNLFSCTEQLIVPVLPTTCPTGTGTAGPPGRDGVDGAPGANGLPGLSTRIQIGDVTQNGDCLNTPTASITPPDQVGNERVQTLSFNFPPPCPSGPGGSGGPTVSSIGNLQTTTLAKAESIRIHAGINTDLTGFIPPVAPGSSALSDIINIHVHCKVVGFIKLMSYRWSSSRKRWVYQGHPHLFMIGDENEKVFTDQLPTNHPYHGIFLSEIINVADRGDRRALPLFAQLHKLSGCTSGSICRSIGINGKKVIDETLETSIQYAEPRPIIPLYQLDGQYTGPLNNVVNKTYYINESYNYTQKQQAIITSAVYNPAYAQPYWLYEIEFGESNYQIQQDIPQDPRLFQAIFHTSSSPETEVYNWQVYNDNTKYGVAYNLNEVGNVINGYGYPVGSYVPPTANSAGGFRLSSSPSFLFSNVPIDTIVDIELDNQGNFYFKETNPIVGGCGS